MYHGLAALGNFEPDRNARTASEAAIRAVAVVAGRRRTLGAGVDCFSRAVAGVEVAGSEELVGRRVVKTATRRLEVRSFVPGDAEPAQRVENSSRPALVTSIAVGVFDSKNEDPLKTLGEQPVEQRRALTR